MPQSAAPRRDPDGRCCRDRAAADGEAAERQRSVRERLEATVSGLGELQLLRQRQEEQVRAALEEQEEREQRREAPRSSEEKLLEENILLLRKQLNCLRRRDAGLISQLEELDRQISDLRLDTEASHDQLETDSRPSSGFYELSDGASGSLSNSSNSIFSECFCSMADADGRLLSADELASCLECDGLVGGLCDDSSSSAKVRRSLSAPHPPAQDPSASSVAFCDSQFKYHCDLVARNGADVYRYPSPLHAVAVQSPAFLQMLGHGGHSKDDGVLRSVEAGAEGLKPESFPLPTSVSAPLVPQSSSWPAPSSSSSSQAPSTKRLDSYIYSLLQRRVLPVRTSRPRTTISTEPSKSVLRQASLCVRTASGPGSGSGFGTLKPSHLAGEASEGGPTSPPQRLRPEDQETQSVPCDDSVDMMQNTQTQSSSLLHNGNQNGHSVSTGDVNTSTNILLKKTSRRLLPPSAVSTATKDSRELDNPKASSSPKEYKHLCCPPNQDQPLKSQPVVKTQRKSPQMGQTQTGDGSALERSSLGSSSQSQEDAGGEGRGTRMVNGNYIPTQRQNIKLHKGGSKKVKTVKVKMSRASQYQEPPSESRGDKHHNRAASKKSRLLDDSGSLHIRGSRRASGGSGGVSSSRLKRLPASIPEGRALDKHATLTLSSVRSGASRHHHHGNHHHHSGHHHHHHHHHGRDQIVVVAKPKYKRSDYRRLRAIMEVPYDQAFRRTQRRQRKELLDHPAASMYPPSDGQVSSLYACVGGSDSEYSAECASLFHSTILDTSEDERSNYTTNRFGDSESSVEEDVEESTATSDTEESGGGGAGGGTGGADRGRRQLTDRGGARVAGQEMTASQAKALVKIKASHNLKKRILRFRSGSLKLMTTV
ncbi:dapper homolog 1 [Pempheris klunzingeri]|uniref:dapper homolog 1 n=1 Tax=Pempheris klunzingeri TaxID=3127111 RepID=UPI00397EB66D